MGYETDGNFEKIKTNTLVSGTLNTNFTWGACNLKWQCKYGKFGKIIINYYHEFEN